MPILLEPPVVRRRLRVRGQVQGVGFRPFVFRIATDLQLGGRVLNDGAGVEIDIQGSAEQLDRFSARLRDEAPLLARIDAIEITTAAVEADAPSFAIDASGGGEVTTGITPDAAICTECLADMFDPTNRRWRYAFTNCTHCGPRYTITGALPYDRPNTSMARFTQCPACQREYDDPLDRRFHAQPNACPTCGPRLTLSTPEGRVLADEDPVAATVTALRAGRIVAIKGLGGFHLACDARNAQAVAMLRSRKQREEKPFAILAANIASLAEVASVSASERALLEGIERPIVLLGKRTGCDESLSGVAPGIASLGVMLPGTPLQVLLFHEAAGRPAGQRWLTEPQSLLLVMTSANPGGEPLVIGNAEAVARLGAIADLLLLHDRDIVIRCDDSVVRPTHHGSAFVRRARGYTPRPIPLAEDAPPVLAVGGYFKNTVCVTRGREAFVSQHIGSLDNAPTCNAMADSIAHLLDVLRITPVAVAHDLHPDFFSTRLAAGFASERGVPLTGVQHHHAHIAAVAAEHRFAAPLLGVALDGVGLGSDGKAWGGELLIVDGADMRRVGHLRELPMAGGDRAAREPWRLAAAVLHLLDRDEEIERRYRQTAAPIVRHMLQQRFNTPLTSSMGRWFDAAAGLLHVRHQQSFEGQAPMLLEGLAAAYGPVAPLADGYAIVDGVLDLLPLAAALIDERNAAHGAALFHATLVDGLAQWTAAAARQTGLDTVAFGGGCFLNAIVSRGLRVRCEAAGLRVLEASAVPANDGGLSLGQAYVARLTAARRN
jgi:hydrogenase maturation protein HypF